MGITDNSAQNQLIPCQLGPHKTRPMPTQPKFIRQLGPNSQDNSAHIFFEVHTGFPVFLVFLLFPSFLNMLLVFPSFV